MLGAETQKQNTKPTYSKMQTEARRKSNVLVSKWGCHFFFFPLRKKTENLGRVIRSLMDQTEAVMLKPLDSSAERRQLSGAFSTLSQSLARLPVWARGLPAPPGVRERSGGVLPGAAE